MELAVRQKLRDALNSANDYPSLPLFVVAYCNNETKQAQSLFDKFVHRNYIRLCKNLDIHDMKLQQQLASTTTLKLQFHQDYRFHMSRVANELKKTTTYMKWMNLQQMPEQKKFKNLPPKKYKLYKPTNAGKKFISVDLREAFVQVFFPLHYNSSVWPDFMHELNVPILFAKSKHFRNMCLNTMHSKRTANGFHMSQISVALSRAKITDIAYDISNEVLPIAITEDEAIWKYGLDVIDLHRLKNYEDSIHVEMFTLYYLPNLKLYIKDCFNKDLVSVKGTKDPTQQKLAMDTWRTIQLQKNSKLN